MTIVVLKGQYCSGLNILKNTQIKAFFSVDLTKFDFHELMGSPFVFFHFLPP
jgi:hypothetical protein